MKPLALLTALALGATLSVYAADKPLLAIPGKVISESKLDTAPGAPWRAAISEATLNPEWEIVKATLPKHGEKVAAGPAAKGKAGAKGKKKAE